VSVIRSDGILVLAVNRASHPAIPADVVGTIEIRTHSKLGLVEETIQLSSQYIVVNYCMATKMLKSYVKCL